MMQKTQDASQSHVTFISTGTHCNVNLLDMGKVLTVFSIHQLLLISTLDDTVTVPERLALQSAVEPRVRCF